MAEEEKETSRDESALLWVISGCLATPQTTHGRGEANDLA